MATRESVVLYRRAKELRIAGRSRMNEAELREAVTAAETVSPL